MQNLRGLTRTEIEKAITALGENPAHAAALFKTVHRTAISSWSEATGIPARLTDKLAREYTLETTKPERFFSSQLDGTKKMLFRFADGATAECVTLFGGGRTTACLSSQSGCACGCAFCATGALGFKRNLEPHEIISQFNAALAAANGKLDNIVFMGMGEPFLNWPSVQAAILILSDCMGRYFPQSRISVSTVGIISGINTLAASPLKINLAISVITADEETRARLAPMQGKYPLAEVMAAARKYCETTGKKVFLEYILFDGLNDSPAHAAKLAELAQSLPCTVNLIRYNAGAGTGFSPSPPETATAFHKLLVARGVRTYLRAEQGADIAAACGQLAAKPSAQ